MSANAMKPTFTDRESYLRWRAEWKTVYNELSTGIRADARKVANQAREGKPASALQRELVHKRVMARKMMTLLDEAKLRRDRILEMHKKLAEQNSSFPLTLTKCRTIDLHFNKVSLEFSFMPAWVLKAQGKQYFVSHLEATVPWSTRELPEGSTRGMIRLRNSDVTINKECVATVHSSTVELKAVA